MPGTYADQATLATDNAFISLCRVALIKRALELSADTERHSIAELSLYSAVLNDALGYAQRMAWLVAAGNATIGAAAPAVPVEGDVQYAVNQTLPTLVR